MTKQSLYYMATTASEALKLVETHKAEFIKWYDHENRSSLRYVIIRRANGSRDEYVDLGEVRDSGTLVIPGTLMGRNNDFPPVYERIPGYKA